MSDYGKIKEDCRNALERNNQGVWTQPADGFYPNQWLWDSAFTAIGYSTYDHNLAIKEVISLLEGQWDNGMLPNMIFRGGGIRGWIDKRFWSPGTGSLAPNAVATSGITQPPVLTTAVRMMAGRMPHKEAADFIMQVTPPLIRYHNWLYNERDQDEDGLITLIHPWETGLDNTPGWVRDINRLPKPKLLSVITSLKIDRLVDRLRPDTQGTSRDQRSESLESLHLLLMIRRLRKEKYQPLDSSNPASGVSIESLSFNSIFAAANQDLIKLSAVAGIKLPRPLQDNIRRTRDALAVKLWDPESEKFGHYNRVSKQLEPLSGVSMLTPLYSGAISARQAAQLVKDLKDEKRFAAPYPIPSVALNDPEFKPHRYWQGPVWINTNWLIIRGLRKYGYESEASELSKSTIELVKKSGIFEYYSALDARPLGAKNFSWTAALVLDLIHDLEA